MKKIEAILIKAGDDNIYFQEYWVPSHGLEEAKKARAEGKVVIISICDCGCWSANEWRGSLSMPTQALVKELFGDDPLIACGYRKPRKGEQILLVTEEEVAKTYGFNSLVIYNSNFK